MHAPYHRFTKKVSARAFSMALCQHQEQFYSWHKVPLQQLQPFTRQLVQLHTYGPAAKHGPQIALTFCRRRAHYAAAPRMQTYVAANVDAT